MEDALGVMEHLELLGGIFPSHSDQWLGASGMRVDEIRHVIHAIVDDDPAILVSVMTAHLFSSEDVRHFLFRSSCQGKNEKFI